MIKTTQKHFEIFKKEVRKWVDIFQLNGWQIYFKHKTNKTDFGGLATILKNKVATFFFTQSFDDAVCSFTEEAIKKTARHEVIHLLLARLSCLVSERFVSENEVEEAEEEIVNILVNYINKKIVH